MQLRDVLIREAFYGATNYWILPNGKVKKLSGGHEDYLADEGLSYGKAFHTGHIRLAVDDKTSTPTAEWSRQATSAAKRVLTKLVKDSDEVFYDIVEPNTESDLYRPKYLKTGNTDYRGFLKLR